METLRQLRSYENFLKRGIQSFEECPVGNYFSSRAYGDALELLYSKHPELKEDGLEEEIDFEEVIVPKLDDGTIETRFPDAEEESPPHGIFWRH